VLRTSKTLGIRTPLQPYPATALGASEVSLLELATAYRTLASGVLAPPYVMSRVVLDSGRTIAGGQRAAVPANVAAGSLALIQEGLRGVVRLPSGTAHALDSRAFPVAVMGKTGTTNDFRDAIFVGSTYGLDGVTVAVRIGFDDGRSLGSRETGGRAALPVFRDVMLQMYQRGIAGPAPVFPARMEQRITQYLHSDDVPPAEGVPSTVSDRRTGNHSVANGTASLVAGERPGTAAVLVGVRKGTAGVGADR
jgi:penicillin-binding protein 1A